MTVGKVVTVRGPIDPEQLGVVLPHEHLFLQTENWFVPPSSDSEAEFARLPVRLDTLAQLRYRPYSNWDNLHIDDYAIVVAEVERFRKAGGSTIVELTVPAIGRDPARMRQLSEDTGVHVVCGCGYYVASAHPPDIGNMSAPEITEVIVAELLAGVADSGVRPGVIGEVGTSYPITPGERKVLAAAAGAHRRTGAPISVHLSTGPNDYWDAVLDILEDGGVQPGVVALSHLDGYHPFDIEMHARLARRGAYVEYDLFGITEFSEDGLWPPPPSDLERIDAVVGMWEMGFGDRLLLSHDVCTKFQQVAFGGFGFAHLPAHVAPVMRSMGLEDGQIDTMFRANPARWLAWSQPQEE